MLALEFRADDRHFLLAADFGDRGLLSFCLGHLRECGQLIGGRPLRRVDGTTLGG